MKRSNLINQIAVGAMSCAMIACTEPAEPQPDPEAAAQVGRVEALPQNLPPPTETAPRYVGLWATAAEGCTAPAWRFEANQITALGEVACVFQNVAMTERGYDIQAQCSSEGEISQHNLQLSFAESARAMMISGGPWQSGTALVYCSPLSAE